ncbi:MAG: ATP-grasp domain-containing protein [Parasphingopyxis sp.]|uniref:ATP-grasp domain-containing protein n=1 Tax=Parasphingopyxis sp. TaxID=1920299 RepID=UPI003F9F6DC7
MRIAYLSCPLTLSDSPDRRPDAFEHDQMVDCLSDAFESHGNEIAAVSWDDTTTDWSDFDAALIGSTWDYQDRLDAFLERLAHIERETRLFNPCALVRWNSRKTYLRDLESKGVRTVPTLWLDVPGETDARAAFDALDSDDIVFKRQVGANAEGQFRLKRGDPVPAMAHPMMAQPFLPAIRTEGELSFAFVDGGFSHALVKSAAAGDYRIQSSYGGREAPHRPDPSDMAAATAVIGSLADQPLYARVDMVRGEDGDLLLIELELIEPFLYPLQGPGLGARLHSALRRRLG